MIERKFIQGNMLEYDIKEFVQGELKRAGLSDVKFQRTPLGEKIIIHAHRPGLVVGRGGANIADITRKLKRKFKLENPQVEIEEVTTPNLDPNIIAEMIANSLERFGPARFKGIGYKALNDVMNAGARGVEIIVTGRVPSARAKKWRFYAGYLKKCGDVAITGIKSGFCLAVIKAGAVGVKVKIMTPDTKLPDDVEIYETETMGIEDVTTETPVAVEEVKELPEEAKQVESEDVAETQDTPAEETADDAKEEKPAQEETQETEAAGSKKTKEKVEEKQ